MSYNTLTDLPSLKEEHLPVLAEMGIESLSELRDAVADEAGAKEVIDALKGVGPKTMERWQGILADLDDEDLEEEVEVVAESKVEIVEDDDDYEDEDDDDDLIYEEGEYLARAKPELDPADAAMLKKRKEISKRRPAFKRQEWHRYARLGEMWRRPKGIHSKTREGWHRRPPAVNIGFRGPKGVRGLHPSGFEDVLVHNVAELEALDPKTQAARVGGSVGTKKRIDIEDRADELGIRVLNRMG